MHITFISDQTDLAGISPALCYDSTGFLANILSHNEIMAEYDNGMTAILQQSLFSK